MEICSLVRTSSSSQTLPMTPVITYAYRGALPAGFISSSFGTHLRSKHVFTPSPTYSSATPSFGPSYRSNVRSPGPYTNNPMGEDLIRPGHLPSFAFLLLSRITPVTKTIVSSVNSAGKANHTHRARAHVLTSCMVPIARSLPCMPSTGYVRMYAVMAPARLAA